MATPAAVPSGGPSSGSNPRWARSGETGSAFSGLTRPGRGRGRGGGRGGRGAGRGHPPSSRDPKPELDARSTKHETLQSPAPASAKPSTSPAPPAPAALIPPPATVKSSVPPAQPSSSKPKPASRKPSRAIPPSINTQIQAAEVASAPSSAKPSSRRRRSTAGKTPAPLPPKINPPAPNDNLLRPNRPRVGPIPNTAPVKDTPPHLNQRFDMRNDIDALVERVRAVAMDNRPSTPGSHIDWAGDDDDSLPDLNDWGVNTATFGATTNKSEDPISPIIVGGLRPLPDILSTSMPNSPLRKLVETAPSALEKQESVVEEAIPSPSKGVPPTNDARIDEAATPVVKPVDSEAKTSSAKLTATPTINAPPRNPLHPSLPAKPVNAPSVTPLKSWAAATPMRNPPYPKALNKDSFTERGPKFAPELVPSTDSSAPIEEPPSVTIVAEKPSEEAQGPVRKPEIPTDLIVKPTTSDSASFEGVSTPDGSDPQDTQAANKSRISDDLVIVEGLGASMHAPKAITDSLSAPANMSSYSNMSGGGHHGPSLTHTRAHTVGRPPSFPKPSHNDYNQRFTRSGHSTPRGGFHDSYHTRTRSTPPTGAHNSHNRPHHRPVITGDAISRLARTIGKTNVSPTKNTLTTLGD